MKGNRRNASLPNSVRRGNKENVELLISQGADVDVKDENGWAPLHLTAQEGHKEIVELLIHHGADVDGKGDDGCTPLHWSTFHGHKEIVELLIHHGADVDVKNTKGSTPLHLSALKGHKEIVELLIHHGADVDVKDEIGWAPLHWSAREGHKEIVELLIHHGVDVDGKGDDGWAPLHLSALKGHKEIVELLIHHGADVDVKDETGWAPLHWSAQEGHKEIVELLIHHGADVDVKNTKGSTPLHSSALKGHKEIVELLIHHGADVDVKGKDGWAPLHLSALNGHKEIVELLIHHGADVDVKGKDGWALLHLSALNGHKEIVELLIHHGADVDVKGEDGWTPLHWSAQEGHKEIVELLIHHGADVDVKDTNGCTPLHRSTFHGHKEIVKLLIHHGADVDVKDEDGCTPLHWNTQEGHKEIVELLINHGADVDVKDEEGWTPLHWSTQGGHKEIVELLIHHGADVDVKDEDGCTPLHWSTQGGHKEIVELLINHGADVDVKDEDGCTPLHWSTLGGHKEIVELLINHGADVDVKDEDGCTPLHWSTQGGHKEIVELLINHGADVDVKDEQGWTPLHWSIRNGHKEIVELLINHGADVDVKDEQGWTPLHEAVRLYNIFENTSLSLGGQKKKAALLKSVQLLIEFGADIDSVDALGATPLKVAERHGHRDLVDILKRAKFTTGTGRGLRRGIMESGQARRQLSAAECSCPQYSTARGLCHSGATLNKLPVDVRKSLSLRERLSFQKLRHQVLSGRVLCKISRLPALLLCICSHIWEAFAGVGNMKLWPEGVGNFLGSSSDCTSANTKRNKHNKMCVSCLNHCFDGPEIINAKNTETIISDVTDETSKTQDKSMRLSEVVNGGDDPKRYDIKGGGKQPTADGKMDIGKNVETTTDHLDDMINRASHDGQEPEKTEASQQGATLECHDESKGSKVEMEVGVESAKDVSCEPEASVQESDVKPENELSADIKKMNVKQDVENEDRHDGTLKEYHMEQGPSEMKGPYGNDECHVKIDVKTSTIHAEVIEPQGSHVTAFQMSSTPCWTYGGVPATELPQPQAVGDPDVSKPLVQEGEAPAAPVPQPHAGGDPVAPVPQPHAGGDPVAPVPQPHAGGDPVAPVPQPHAGGDPVAPVPQPHAGGDPVAPVPQPHAGGDPVAPVPQPHAGGDPVARVPQPHAGGDPVAPVPQPHAGGDPVAPVPQPHAGGDPVAPVPQPHAGGDPVAPVPQPHAGGDPVAPVPQPHAGGDPVAPVPQTYAGGDPVAPVPETYAGGDPVAPVPQTYAGGDPVAPVPETYAGGDPVAPVPQTYAGGDPVAPVPQTYAGGDPVAPVPQTHEERDPVTPIPLHHEGGDPLAPIPQPHAGVDPVRPIPQPHAGRAHASPIPQSHGGGTLDAPIPHPQADKSSHKRETYQQQSSQEATQNLQDGNSQQGCSNHLSIISQICLIPCNPDTSDNISATKTKTSSASSVNESSSTKGGSDRPRVLNYRDPGMGSKVEMQNWIASTDGLYYEHEVSSQESDAKPENELGADIREVNVRQDVVNKDRRDGTENCHTEQDPNEVKGQYENDACHETIDVKTSTSHAEVIDLEPEDSQDTNVQMSHGKAASFSDDRQKYVEKSVQEHAADDSYYSLQNNVTLMGHEVSDVATDKKNVSKGPAAKEAVAGKMWDSKQKLKLSGETFGPVEQISGKNGQTVVDSGRDSTAKGFHMKLETQKESQNVVIPNNLVTDDSSSMRPNYLSFDEVEMTKSRVKAISSSLKGGGDFGQPGSSRRLQLSDNIRIFPQRKLSADGSLSESWYKDMCSLSRSLTWQNLTMYPLERFGSPCTPRKHPTQILGIPWDEFERETMRLASFSRYPTDSYKSSTLLAESGFVYIGDGRNDKVICFYCHLEKENWRDHEDTREVHKAGSPHCPMVMPLTFKNNTTGTEATAPASSARAMTYSSSAGLTQDGDFSSLSSSFASAQVEDEVNIPPRGHRPLTSMPHVQAGQQSIGNTSSATPYTTRGASATARHQPQAEEASPRQESQEATQNHQNERQDDSRHNRVNHPNVNLQVYSIPRDSETSDNLSISITTTTSQSAQTVKGVKPTAGSSKQPRSLNYRDLGILCEKPNHPELAVIVNRVMTYDGWPQEHHLRPDDLAKAGLYYAGVEDYVKCYYCGVGLGNWKEGDDPFLEHARLFPNCGHIRQSLGDDFVGAVQELKEQGYTTITMAMVKNFIVRRGMDMKNQDIQELKDQNYTLRNNRICKICMDKEVRMVFLPCGHLVSCQECAIALQDCPVCRKHIRATVRCPIH